MVRICFISDVHNKYKKIVLPDADIIVCSGDMTSVGKEHEVTNFYKWFSNLSQYKHKVFIAGNHDKMFENHGMLARSLKPSNIIYLEDNGIELLGLKFYGTPVNGIFHNWAFNRTEAKMAQHRQAIPDDIDILITHNPPYMILDKGYDFGSIGSPSLYMEVMERIKPMVHVFGHAHDSHGIKVLDKTVFINASILDGEYNVVYNPVLVEIEDNEIIILQK